MFKATSSGRTARLRGRDPAPPSRLPRLQPALPAPSGGCAVASGGVAVIHRSLLAMGTRPRPVSVALSGNLCLCLSRPKTRLSCAGRPVPQPSVAGDALPQRPGAEAGQPEARPRLCWPLHLLGASPADPSQEGPAEAGVARDGVGTRRKCSRSCGRWRTCRPTSVGGCGGRTARWRPASTT